MLTSKPRQNIRVSSDLVCWLYSGHPKRSDTDKRHSENSLRVTSASLRLRGKSNQQMPESPQQPEAAPQLESGTYEILRNRLKGHGEKLRERLGTLNEARKEVFGSIDLKLLSTERITTDHNCVPRDMVAVGNRFLFGYNVQFGLKTERHIADVFAVYEFGRNDESSQAHGLQPVGTDLLSPTPRSRRTSRTSTATTRTPRSPSSSSAASTCTWSFRSARRPPTSNRSSG